MLRIPKAILTRKSAEVILYDAIQHAFTASCWEHGKTPILCRCPKGTSREMFVMLYMNEVIDDYVSSCEGPEVRLDEFIVHVDDLIENNKTFTYFNYQ